MTQETNPTNALLPTMLVFEQIVAGKIDSFLDYGVLVKVGDEMTLLKDDQVSGGTHGNRATRRKEMKVGEEVMVEVRSIRPPADNKRRNRIRVSERSIQEAAVLSALQAGTETEPGTVINVVVKEVCKDYVLVDIVDGVALGYQAILHATNAPGDDRHERDAWIAARQVGEAITAECLHCKRPEDPRKDLLIGLTLNAEVGREIYRTLTEDPDKVWSGKAGRAVEGGIEVRFGSQDFPFYGFLPGCDVPKSTKFGNTLRIKVESVDLRARSIKLNRKGL